MPGDVVVARPGYRLYLEVRPPPSSLIVLGEVPVPHVIAEEVEPDIVEQPALDLVESRPRAPEGAAMVPGGPVVPVLVDGGDVTIR